MKRLIALFVLLTFGASLIFFASCNKDDTTAPSITILGANPDSIVLNNTAATDPGATAEDDEDGTVVVTSDWSTVVNLNLAGTYTVTYYAEDAAGNVATETRTVVVYNQAVVFEGIYNVTDSTEFGQVPYHDTVTASLSVNKEMQVKQFAAYGKGKVTINVNSAPVIVGTPLTVPSQNVLCGSPAATRNFTGSGSVKIKSPMKFVINYTELTNSQTTVGRGTYIKQ